MAKRVRQIRYYGNADPLNYPEGLTHFGMVSGEAFNPTNAIGVIITQLGIQAPPGTKFTINGSSQPIIIGATGIYELNVEGLTSINSISFNGDSLRNVELNPSSYIIVDYIYEQED